MNCWLKIVLEHSSNCISLHIYRPKSKRKVHLAIGFSYSRKSRPFVNIQEYCSGVSVVKIHLADHIATEMGRWGKLAKYKNITRSNSGQFDTRKIVNIVRSVHMCSCWCWCFNSLTWPCTAKKSLKPHCCIFYKFIHIAHLTILNLFVYTSFVSGHIVRNLPLKSTYTPLLSYTIICSTIYNYSISQQSHLKYFDNSYRFQYEYYMFPHSNIECNWSICLFFSFVRSDSVSVCAPKFVKCQPQPHKG